jgi:aminopeptidase YwaD
MLVTPGVFTRAAHIMMVSKNEHQGANTMAEFNTAGQAMPEKAAHYLHTLCVEMPTRQVGSAGNRAATDFTAAALSRSGFETECPPLSVMDWAEDGAWLAVDDDSATFELLPSPYTRGGQAQGPLVVISTVNELAAAELDGKVALLRGELAKEQLMPKNFVFYNPDHHQQIIQLLEEKQPLALISATGKNPALAGAVYPFPMFEDGDFDIPSVYMTDVAGEELATYAGQTVSLEIRATRIPSTSYNVIARKGRNGARRVVVSAHIDAKKGTPGALDNGTGVVALLLLAELLADYDGDTTIELVAFNGEDYYSAAGEMDYLARNEGRFNEIILNVNIDDMGYKDGATAYSLYDCPPSLAQLVTQTFAPYDDLIPGELWYQSDHSLFIQQQVPAVAITSEMLQQVMGELAHTALDQPDQVNHERVANSALALNDLLRQL